jgi:hypothetical protein
MTVPDPIVTATPLVPMQRLCGWCRAELAPGTQPATFGICARCQLQLELDVTRQQEGRARSERLSPSRGENPGHRHVTERGR